MNMIMNNTLTPDTIRIMRKRAKMHEDAGNTLLAQWLQSSATHKELVLKDINRQLNIMDRERTNREYNGRRSEFASEWYEYEEEYAYNFMGEN